ncbi:DMT family transporter [Streptomyces piniterrae]|uniref:DMT family transporter n=1 Tax=Streptomyces piniterrae TaxID=2571125 RepID=A0A4V5MLU4_9ACTN|nr:DMT family transporter [Streptomyces piniterrae]TJZ57218.1 DMT family transporter [Streptomyces piniterrae]
MTPAPSSRRSWLTDAPVLAVAIAWGSSYLATKSITTPSTVMATLLLRFLLAVAVLGLLRLRAIRRLTVAEVRGGVIIGLILTGVFLLETYGVVHTSATNAGLIISLTMVFTPLAEAALCRTRPPGSFLMAAAGSVLGVLLLTQGGGFTAPSVGDLLMLLAALARTANVLTTHRLASIKSADDGALTFVQLATAVICFAALSTCVGTPPLRVASALEAGQWLDLLYLGLLCTLFAFFVQLWAVRRTNPSRVSLLLGTEPLWAAVIGVALGGDQLGAAGYAGAALILIGTAWGRRAAEASDGQPQADTTAPPEQEGSSTAAAPAPSR